MASFLRSPLGRALRGAAGGLQQGYAQHLADQREQKMLALQQQMMLERQTQQAALQRGNAEYGSLLNHALNVKEQGIQSGMQAESSRSASIQQLLDKVATDENMTLGSAQAQMQRLSPTDEEMGVLESLFNEAAQQRQKRAEEELIRNTLANTDAIGPGGLEGRTLPNGQFLRTQQTGQEAGQVEGDKILTQLGIAGRAQAAQVGRETAAREANTLQLISGEDPNTGQPVFAYSKPGSPAEYIDDIRPRVTSLGAGTGSGSGNPRVDSARDQVKRTFEQMMELDKALTQESGVMGAVEGIGDVLSVKGQTDPNAVAFKGLSESILPAFARLSGEVGNLAQQEQERFRFLVPNVGDGFMVRAAKYQAGLELAQLEGTPATREQIIAQLEAKRRVIEQTQQAEDADNGIVDFRSLINATGN